MARKAPAYPTGGSPREVKQILLSNFSGGLNLTATPFQLADNESPNMMDVDLMRLGGVRRRKAIIQVGSIFAQQPDGTWVYTKTDGTQSILYAVRGGAVTNIYRTSAPSTSIATLNGAQCRAITMNSINYIVAGHNNSTLRWDGTTLANLGGLRYDDPDGLPHGNFPRAKVVAIHQGSAWCANIYEDGAAHPCRIRYSWPNEPEDWPSFGTETLDIGADGDEITALVSHNERLLVFKRNAVYAVYGEYGNFRFVPLAQTVGAISQEAVVKTDTDVYFFDWPNGLYKIGVSGPPVPVWDRLRPITEGGFVESAHQGEISVSWCNRRIFVSVPYESESFAYPKNTRTYVYDPAIDAWTAHGYGMKYGMSVTPPDQDDYTIAWVHMPLISYRLSVLESAGDSDYGVFPIYGSYQTSWIDAGDAFLAKRFRRMGLVVKTGATLQADQSFDYEGGVSSTSQVLPNGTPTSVWGNNWGSMTWTAAVPPVTQIISGRTAGRGKTVSATIRNITQGDWSLSALAWKYIPRRRKD